jgi:cleavage and polyadenylation specificity factor subunit 4
MRYHRKINNSATQNTLLNQTMDTQIISPGPGPHDLARQILTHQNPSYTFSFSPFLLASHRFGIPPTRPICKAYLQGHCPLGNACPDRHVTPNSNSNFNNLVCKHWLRGLCKKGESCEFLHEYNLRKMPECNFFVRNGYCSNGGTDLFFYSYGPHFIYSSDFFV